MTLHPFLDKTDIPKDENGITEYKYMSKDCFHLTQLGHARAANAYYNSLLMPESKRIRAWKKEFEEFLCPTQQDPFIFTSKNGWMIQINKNIASRNNSNPRFYIDGDCLKSRLRVLRFQEDSTSHQVFKYLKIILSFINS